ncbi:MAG TPA: GNAT family N-acetyltransferase [Sphingomicrobium sp.]
MTAGAPPTTPYWSGTIEIVDAPSQDLRQAILSGLIEFNSDNAAPAVARPLCIALRDQAGACLGGLWGNTLYDWLAIELLFVPDAHRRHGLGARLLSRAEEESRARGCIGAWLDTFSFQARGFYERLGYSIAGQIPDHPLGGARYFLMKRWAA